MDCQLDKAEMKANKVHKQVAAGQGGKREGRDSREGAMIEKRQMP